MSVPATHCHGQGSTLQDSKDVISSDGVPYQVRDVRIDQKIGEMIPLGLELTTSEGDRVKTARFFDGTKPTIVTLNYSNCPMLCSLQLNGLVRSLRDLDLQVGKDFNILTVSIDPKETTAKAAETKGNYVAQLSSAQPDADEGWTFCTTSQPVINELADRLGFRYTYDRASGEYYHATMLAFVSPQGKITRYSLAVDFPVNDLRKALVEAGDGKLGSIWDQAVLWCFRYDPDANSYTLVGRRIMYFGGLVFAGSFLAVLLPFWMGRKSRALSPVDCSPDEMPSAKETKETQLFQKS
ncbi:MAG: SCO family protein [Planctomycetota bacterium]